MTRSPPWSGLHEALEPGGDPTGLVMARVVEAADEPERHRMRVHAALMVLHEPAVVSHQSAALVLGLTL